MFEYMTAQEAAEKWNVSLRWVHRVWLIPKNALKPIDGRKAVRKPFKMGNATWSLHLENAKWWFFTVKQLF